MVKLKTSERLLAALEEAVEWTRTLSPEDAAAMEEAQRASWQAITGGPTLSYRWVNGIRVYAPWPCGKSSP